MLTQFPINRNQIPFFHENNKTLVAKKMLSSPDTTGAISKDQYALISWIISKGTFENSKLEILLVNSNDLESRFGMFATEIIPEK